MCNQALLMAELNHTWSYINTCDRKTILFEKKAISSRPCAYLKEVMFILISQSIQKTSSFRIFPFRLSVYISNIGLRGITSDKREFDIICLLIHGRKTLHERGR